MSWGNMSSGRKMSRDKMLPNHIFQRSDDSPLFPESQFHRRANLICASHPHTPNLAPLNPAQTFTMFYELVTQLDTPGHILGRSILSFLLFLDTFGKGWKVRRLEGKKIRKLEGWKARILESWKAGGLEYWKLRRLEGSSGFVISPVSRHF